MRLEVLKFLWDVQDAARSVVQFEEGKTFEDHEDSLLLRAAVERQFITIGEALTRLMKIEPGITISDVQPIIASRNVLVHGYDIVDDSRVWNALRTNLPILISEVDRLMGEGEDESSGDDR